VKNDIENFRKSIDDLRRLDSFRYFYKGSKTDPEVESIQLEMTIDERTMEIIQEWLKVNVKKKIVIEHNKILIDPNNKIHDKEWMLRMNAERWDIRYEVVKRMEMKIELMEVVEESRGIYLGAWRSLVKAGLAGYIKAQRMIYGNLNMMITVQQRRFGLLIKLC
jgi:hypothetical protein